jgi:hypothetical protein
MGCGDSRNLKKDVVAGTIESKSNPDPLNLVRNNDFQFWFQIFDFLELRELLGIAVVCKTWHNQSGNLVILSKFAKGR